MREDLIFLIPITKQFNTRYQRVDIIRYKAYKKQKKLNYHKSRTFGKHCTYKDSEKRVG